MVTIYPTRIKGTTGRNTKVQTQRISNPQNLCSGNTSLASWGEYTPSWCGGGVTIYCNTLTTKSGSFENPEEIYTDGWDNNLNTIPSDAIIKTVKVEYAYALAHYPHFGIPKITKQPTFSLQQNGKVIKSVLGDLPPACANMKSGNLPQKSVTFTNVNITSKDFKNTSLHFKAGGNIASEVGRLLMQYLRISITYENPNPKYNVSISAPNSIKVNTSYKCNCTITNSNANNKSSICYIQIPTNTTISNPNIALQINKTTDTYTIYQCTINQPTIITFDLKHSTIGTKTIKSWLSNYCTTTAEKQVEVTKPNIDFIFTPQLSRKVNGAYTNFAIAKGKHSNIYITFSFIVIFSSLYFRYNV